MFGRKKQQRIRLANPNYWIMDEYHQHENEGRKTMTKEDVQNMRVRQLCKACADSSTSVESYPCSACYLRTGRPDWTPSSLFLALEEALSVAADKPAELEPMTADEATATLQDALRQTITDYCPPVHSGVIQYAIDAIRRDAARKTGQHFHDAYSRINATAAEKLIALNEWLEFLRASEGQTTITKILDFINHVSE